MLAEAGWSRAPEPSVLMRARKDGGGRKINFKPLDCRRASKTSKRRAWCPPSWAHTLLFLISQGGLWERWLWGRLSSLPKNFCSISTET